MEKTKTQRHIEKVREYLDYFKLMLDKRRNSHDESKLRPPERELFDKYSDKLDDIEYDSEEYWEIMDELKPALKHHYNNNRHHPNFFSNGIEDMNLLDIVEMLFDWWAASQRHEDGDIKESINKNKDRFDMSEQLAKIFQNTVEDFPLD